jgi:hypothetical protein
LNGGPGNDTFRTRDGQPDKVDCGPGFDVVFADFKDIIVDATVASPKGSCERVVRKPARRRDARDEQEADNDDDHFQKEGEKAKRRGGRGHS